MNAVLQRELLVQARSAGNTWLRLAAGGLATAGFYLAVTLLDQFGADNGRTLFLLLHVVTCLVAALACPLLVADSFLSERKAGTLPLLFLTPLTAGNIVSGKLTAHLLRAGSLWLAAAPVLLFPLWMGGVDVNLLAGMLIGEGVLLVLSLVVGIAASAHVDSVGGVIAVTYLVLGMLAMLLAMPLSAAGSQPGFTEASAFLGLGVAVLALSVWIAFGTTVTQIRECWRRSAPVPMATPPPGTDVVPAFQPAWYERWMDRRQRKGTPARAERQVGGSNVAETPMGADSGRPRWIHRRRPAIDWLWARNVMIPGLSACQSVFVGFLSLMTCGNQFRPGPGMGVAFVQLLMASFASVRAFQAERQSGALELLLVTPLHSREFILSHCRKVWHLFGPGVGVHAVVAVGCGIVFGSWQPLVPLIWLAGGLLAVPVIGFWLGLFRGSALGRTAALVLTTLIAPLWIAFGVLPEGTSPDSVSWAPMLATLVVGLMTALAGKHSVFRFRSVALAGTLIRSEPS